MNRIPTTENRRSAVAAQDGHRSRAPRARITPDDQHAPLELAKPEIGGIELGWSRYASSRMRAFKRAW